MTVPKQGEIYRLYSDTVGKARPVLIISREELNGGHDVVAIPFYSQQLEKRRRFPSCVFFGAGACGLDCDCVAKVDEISTIDKADINFAAGSIGILSRPQLQKIFSALDYVVKR